DVDPHSGWSVEAREHLQRLGQSSLHFEEKLLDQTPAANLVRQFPQEARTWAEGPLLAEWADAEAAHDQSRAGSRLALARNIGEALRSAAGEVLLADAVAAIDRAEGGGRSTLVEAHRLYRQARKEYANDRAGAAEVQLRRAATLFAQSGSPMAEVAAYYAANATLDQNRGV